MAAYKLNKLHLHLADDEGWRLAIPDLPELTDIGSQRCFDLTEQHCLLPQLGAGLGGEVNGFYSVKDYQEILLAAQARHIQVIPSMDMPGHSRAAVKAMEARFKRLQLAEQITAAKQYLLTDFDDKTQYSSVQYYHDNTLNVCLESTYVFVNKVLNEIKKMHDAVGVPLTRYHIGADETAGAWVESLQCKTFLANNNENITSAAQLGAYFVERVANMLAEKGIEAAAWNDGLMHTRVEKMPPVIQANAWGLLPWAGFKQAHELANRNWQVVVSTPDVLYFDFPYEADPKEHGYYWASRHINSEKIFQFMPDNLPIHAEFWRDREEKPYVSDDRKQQNEQGEITYQPLQKNRQFLGLQGHLWSENTRTDNTAEYKIFPRLLALAERAWHQADWAVPYNYEGAKYDQNSHVFTTELQEKRDQQWREFAQTVGEKELPKLASANIHYRLPTVGAIIEDGFLHANIAFPGIVIEYKTKNGSWQPYHQPVAVSGDVDVRAVDLLQHRVGRELKVIYKIQ
jgi:hexosaminidase